MLAVSTAPASAFPAALPTVPTLRTEDEDIRPAFQIGEKVWIAQHVRDFGRDTAPGYISGVKAVMSRHHRPDREPEIMEYIYTVFLPGSSGYQGLPDRDDWVEEGELTRNPNSVHIGDPEEAMW